MTTTDTTAPLAKLAAARARLREVAQRLTHATLEDSPEPFDAPGDPLHSHHEPILRLGTGRWVALINHKPEDPDGCTDYGDVADMSARDVWLITDGERRDPHVMDEDTPAGLVADFLRPYDQDDTATLYLLEDLHAEYDGNAGPDFTIERRHAVNRALAAAGELTAAGIDSAAIRAQIETVLDLATTNDTQAWQAATHLQHCLALLDLITEDELARMCPGVVQPFSRSESGPCGTDNCGENL